MIVKAIKNGSKKEEYECEVGGDRMQAYLTFIDYLVNLYGTSSVTACNCDIDNDIANVRIEAIDYEIVFES